MSSKFDFYEIVKIHSDDVRHVNVNGKLAVIRGRVENEATHEWSYGVSLCEGDGAGVVLRMYEKYLVSTGKIADPKEFEAGESVKIEVDPNTGVGRIVDSDDIND